MGTVDGGRRGNGATEEAKTPSPLFIKRSLALNQPRGGGRLH